STTDPMTRASRATRQAAVVLAGRARRREARPRTPLGQIVAVAASLAVVAVIAVGAIAVLAAAGFVNALAQGLPDPANLESLTFSQPTIVYDRTGSVELARFQQEHRRVVSYGELPKVVLDAVTTAEDRTFWQNDGSTAEDRTFWQNDGFDPLAIAAAAVQDAT